MTVLSTLTNISRLLSGDASSLGAAGEQSATVERGESSTDLPEQRQFRFNIESDRSLQNIMNNNSNLSNPAIIADFFHSPAANANGDRLTSHYILSKLYNYMKISEMSKYGISVFEMTFASYLSYLTESDLTKLATSYWCNGQHFNCMISHRGDVIRSNNITDDTSSLTLVITNDLLDAAMEGGASVDKIEAMLLQKRIDDCVKAKTHTRYEGDFYLRHLKHRFWDHETLARVYIQNGWLTHDLAGAAMNSFVKRVYERVLCSKLGFVKQHIHKSEEEKMKISQGFLRSFFVSHFDLDQVPKLYQEEIDSKKGENDFYPHEIRKEILTRWCALVELLASRGAHIDQSTFAQLIPLQYALQIGKNTYKIISSSYDEKNRELIPHSYHQENICIPNVIWDVTLSYL